MVMIDVAALFDEAKRSDVRRMLGAAGDAYMAAAPAQVEACCARWGLTFEGTAPGGYPTNLTLFVRRGEERAVLKLGSGDPEQLTEIEALELFAGRHAVRFMAADRSIPALLIERVEPGTELKALGDNREESRIAAALMAALPAGVPATHGLPSVADWLGRALAGYREDPRDARLAPFIDRAAHLFDALTARSSGERLLHGDLHHENVLFDEAWGWLAIDPKGVIGPVEFECGRFIHNFMEGYDEGQLRACIAERADCIGETLGIAPEWVLEAGLIDATMGTCWALASHFGNIDRAVTKIRVMASLLDA